LYWIIVVDDDFGNYFCQWVLMVGWIMYEVGEVGWRFYELYVLVCNYDVVEKNWWLGYWWIEMLMLIVWYWWLRLKSIMMIVGNGGMKFD